LTVYYWVGGTNENADVASNWSPTGIPGSGDTAHFDSNAINDCLFNISTVSSIWVREDFNYNLRLIGVSSTCFVQEIDIEFFYGNADELGLYVYPNVTLKVYTLKQYFANPSERAFIKNYSSSTGYFNLEISPLSLLTTTEYFHISDANLEIKPYYTYHFSQVFSHSDLYINQLKIGTEAQFLNCDNLKINELSISDSTDDEILFENTDVDMYSSTYWYFSSFNPDDDFTITRTNSFFKNFEPSIHYNPSTTTGAYTQRLGFPEQLQLLTDSYKSNLLKDNIVGAPKPYADIISGGRKVKFGCTLGPNSLNRITGTLRQIEEQFDIVGFTWYDGIVKKGILTGEPIKTYYPADERMFIGEIEETL